MTMFRGAGIGLVFLVGCAVGGAAGHFVVPPASAQQAATLTKWEYICIDTGYKSGEGVTRDANRLGQERWEMVTVDKTTWCFKRPKL